MKHRDPILDGTLHLVTHTHRDILDYPNHTENSQSTQAYRNMHVGA